MTQPFAAPRPIEPKAMTPAQRYAKKYNDSSAVSHLFRTRLIRVYEMLGKIDGLNLLDVGCGSGIISTYILENRGRYFGVDLSKDMLNQCRKTLAEDECSPLSQATRETLPFSNASLYLPRLAS